MNKFFTLLLCLVSLTAIQAQSLNRTNAAGKKDGRWFVYLDANGQKVSDTTKAVYKRYTWFDDGTNTIPMGWFVPKDGKIETTGATAEKGKIVVLNGEYKCYDKSGKLKYVHVFDNGNYVSYKEYFPSGSLQTHFDYTNHCDGQEHSWHSTVFDETGKKLVDDCVKKGADGKWPKMRG